MSFLLDPPKRLSSGILVLNPDRELLLCHVTGQSHWDLPKGGVNPGETPLQAALRETREETGLTVDPARLREIGLMPYTSKKNLHLYAVCMPRFPLDSLHCDSHFADRVTGRSRPEMDGYAWVPFDGVARRCTAKMGQLLTERIDLGRLLDELSTIEPATAGPIAA